jgi:Protein of unknown function (DUF2927)/Bacterial SH3 domain
MKRNRVRQLVRRSIVLVGIATAVVSVSGFKSLSTGTRSAELITSDRFSPINIRVRPSTRSKMMHYGFSGDRIEITGQQKGEDDRIWYKVKFVATGATGWVRSDLVRVDTNAQPIVASPTIAPASSLISQEQINYFLEVALGSEFRNDHNPTIHKWNGEVRIQYFGNPTVEDLATLDSVIREVNELAQGNIQLKIVGSNPNLTIYFVPESEFRRHEPGYVPTNYGFFMTRWDATGTIRSANVLITSENVTQQERSHLIREELTQSLGLMRDSYKYSNSVFYQPWTDVTQYAEIDRTLIRLLYSPNIQAGMTQAQVMDSLNVQHAQISGPLKF